MIIQMAMKNILRNRKRTFITVLTVFGGVFFSVLAYGFNKGLEWQIGNIYIKTETSNAKVVNSGYKVDELENPLDYPIQKYQDIEKKLAKNPDVKAYSPRINFQASLSNGVDEIGALGLGVDPVKEDRVFQRSRGVIEGTYLKPGEEGVVVGYDLAKLLHLKIGETVTIISQAAEMGMNAYDMEIKGFIRTGDPVLDGGTFFVPLDFAKDFLSLDGITDIAVALRNNSLDRNFRQNFVRENHLRGVKVLTWSDFAQDFIQLVNFRGRIINVLTAMILVMAAAGILNTMLMAMMERKREVGNLMAMGVRKGEIYRLFLLEGSMIGLVGSIAGAVLAAVIVYYFQVNGIPLGGAVSKTLGDVPIAGKLYTYLDFGQTIFYLLLGIAIAVISTIYPAWKSTKLRPVEALRNEGGK